MTTRGYIRYVKIGDCYQLIEDYISNTAIKVLKTVEHYFIKLFPGGALILKAGYCWDGASGAFDTDSIMRGACEHDAKYELLRQGLISQENRPISDNELEQTCLDDDMNRFRAAYVHEAVEHLAEKAADPSNKRKEYRSPGG